MVVDVQRARLRCRQDMVEVLDALASNGGRLSYDTFVLSVVKKHAVSEQFVDHFVERFYVGTGKLMLVEGVLVARA